MLNLSEYIGITLKGKGEYDCVISPSGMIISTEPANSYLLYNTIENVYSDNKGKIRILKFFNVGAPMVLDSEKYEVLKKKSSVLAYLKEKFECDIL